MPNISIPPAILSKLEQHTNLLNLPILSVIEVTGEDAESFLQGQLCNDVSALTHSSPPHSTQCQLTAYCNPKGRVYAVIRLIRHADGFWMVVPTEVAEQLTNRLKMFVLRAQVRITLNLDIALLGLLNADEENTAPADIARISVDGIIPRQLLLAEKPAMDAWVASTAQACKPDEQLWRLVDILSGIPQIYPQTVEEFIPQMINLDLVDGLSFTKGCYPGQEIVARLRYLGKVKQRMFAGLVEGKETLTPGMPLYVRERPEQKVGRVVDSVEVGENEYVFSGVVGVDNLSDGELVVGSGAGVVTRVVVPDVVPEQAGNS